MPSPIRFEAKLFRCAAFATLAALVLATEAPALESGERAPSFRAPALAGGVVSLEAHRGKIVYLDFWASWCGPCAQALPELEKLRHEFPDADFQVIAVNVDQDADLARNFLARRPVGYPSALDPEGSIPGAFGVQIMPTSFLIDREGVVRHVHRGFRKQDVSSLRERIQELVASGR